MSKTRVCGGTCHNAKGAKCRCWCGGVFHGAAGADARRRFVETFNVDKVPTTEKAFFEATGQRDLFTESSAGDTWRGEIERARARAGGSDREAVHV